MRTSSAELSEFGFGAAFHKQGDGVANRPGEAGILLANNPTDTTRFHSGVDGGKSFSQLVDGLLFTHLDHVDSVQPEQALSTE